MGAPDRVRATQILLYTAPELQRSYNNTALELPCVSLLQVVGGTDSLAGTYNLYSGQATFLDICM